MDKTAGFEPANPGSTPGGGAIFGYDLLWSSKWIRRLSPKKEILVQVPAGASVLWSYIQGENMIDYEFTVDRRTNKVNVLNVDEGDYTLVHDAEAYQLWKRAGSHYYTGQGKPFLYANYSNLPGPASYSIHNQKPIARLFMTNTPAEIHPANSLVVQNATGPSANDYEVIRRFLVDWHACKSWQQFANEQRMGIAKGLSNWLPSISA